VRAELLALRKSALGLTVEALSDCPVIVGLLGDGHPAAAYNKLKHRILGTEGDTALKAVTASLGLTSDQPTHLGRLTDFGVEHGYDQRQVRRYSDKGVRQLAQLLIQSWSPEAAPCLDVYGYQTAPEAFAFMIEVKRPYFIEMREPQVTLYSGSSAPRDLAVDLAAEQQSGMWQVARSADPLEVRVPDETSIAYVWRGELFPKFGMHWRTDLHGYGLTSEALGNKIMVRVLPAFRGTRA
jgi:hypothetical protein